MYKANTYAKLADFGKTLLDKTSIIDGLPHISKHAKEIVMAERCSIFINDFKHNELWTTISDGVDKIVLDSHKGIVGHTIDTKKPIIANEPYKNPNFCSEIDEKTGFVTENLATVPIFNANREVIGVLELLNKYGGFNDKDIKFMVFFAHYISGFLELVSLCENDKK
ncbi:MAG: GAF domain-containing protein [Epsilonproteobacteria bacterium]|nr:GAF domain-containing protein [Campylobacterota bacterium]